MSNKTKNNNNLYNFSTKTPWEFIFVVILYVIGAVGFPTSIFTHFLGDSENAKMLALFISRIICCILPVWLLFEVKNQKMLLKMPSLTGFLIIIPFLLVVVNNFPIIPLINGEAKFNLNNDFIKWLCYLLAVLGGVLLEEITFRGLVLPTLYKYFKNKKNREFLTIFVQAALFGIVHLVNLFAGSGIVPVITQIGYSFLIGAMCGIAFIKSGSFYTAVGLHFIFNIGGLLYDFNMITGTIWTTTTILLTAILAVIVTIYAFYLVFVNKKSNFEQNLIYLEEVE